ncbi:TadE family protein [Actinomadura sp. SCN-SB]|uniref:TadE family protein n=1 Tax=Actinomadura sp. SCN-SB TaxID=3373092 RepID=UPI00375230AF
MRDLPTRRLASTRRRGRDEGSAAVSIAIVFPAIGLLFLALVQAVLVSVAQDIALGAAEEGLRVARARHGTHSAGRDAAAGFAAQEPVLQTPSVTVTGTYTVIVSVHGSAPSVVPGMRFRVERTVRGARERFTTRRQP